MAILTLQEAADILGYVSPDDMPGRVSSILIPAINDCIKTATGKDWGTLTATYTIIDPTAKVAAGFILTQWFEDPMSIGKVNTSNIGIVSLITQLEAKVLVENG